MSNVNIENLIRLSTFAKLTNASPQGIHKAIVRGRLTAIKIDGMKFLEKSQVKQFRSQSRYPHIAEK